MVNADIVRVAGMKVENIHSSGVSMQVWGFIASVLVYGWTITLVMLIQREEDEADSTVLQAVAILSLVSIMAALCLSLVVHWWPLFTTWDGIKEKHNMLKTPSSHRNYYGSMSGEYPRAIPVVNQ